MAITPEGKKHLGAATGTHSFVECYIKQKVSGWVKEVERLSAIANTQPHAAYAAFTHGLTRTYLARTTQDIEHLLKPLECVIRQQFLPAITGQNAFNDADRDLMALPTRLGGLGIANPSHRSSTHFNNSNAITAPLVNLILQQSNVYPPETRRAQLRAKNHSRITRRQHEQAEANEITKNLPPNLQRAMEVSSEKGASTWLSTLLIEEHGFALHKGAFRDALFLNQS